MSAWAALIAKDAGTLAKAAQRLARDVGGVTGRVPATPVAVAAAFGAIPAAAGRAPAPDAAPAPAQVAVAPTAVPAARATAAAAPTNSATAKQEGEPDSTSSRPGPAPAVAAATPDPAPCNPNEPAGYATSAAATLGWGQPNRSEDFDGNLTSWGLYDGVGHEGKGKRTPSAATLKDGVLTITGDSQGSTEGMAWNPGQKYGRWEARVKAPVSDPTYHAVMLLWPDAENWPVGGEVDFMEMSDHTRQSTEMFLHYGASNSQLQGNVKVDATQWHNWAVEWTSTHITAYLDGKQWWSTDKTNALPPGPMHLTLQLDWFPRGGASVQTSQMQVDWVRQYSLSGGTKVTGSDTVTGSDPTVPGSASTANSTDSGHGATDSGHSADNSGHSANNSGHGSALHTVDPAAVKPGLVPAAVETP